MKYPDTLFNRLFNAYEEANDPLSRCASAYLLKNNLQVREQEEDPEEYAEKRRKKKNRN